ncbi:MAG TPA: N-6 DNA methylase [Chitinophagales bacterium]|nr:N-6 DNA methylase [Chitinophagales bacterium]
MSETSPDSALIEEPKLSLKKPSPKSALVLTYLTRIQSASKELTKKEIFKDLLHRLYAGDKEIETIIDKISKGAEAAVLNIPRKDKLHRGSADTLYNRIIIEFENDLKTTLKHAKEQLAGYLLGQFNSGEGYNFTLIASDFVNWKVFAPDISCLSNIESLKEDELILNEIPSASFTLTELNAEDFYYWLDRFLFKEQKQKATLQRIEESFGYQSKLFIECFREMKAHFNEAKKFGEVQVSYEQWKKFLSIAYGSFDASEENFLVHTYLSVFAKMLAYAVVSNDDYISDEEMLGILDGSVFDKRNIRNFVDHDFFHWVRSERSFRNLKKTFRLIAQEISAFDFSEVEEDVLKGVYQELIDLDTRHALGEYYTPDWLCERMVNEFRFRPGERILDPACGSGSFLRAAVHRLRELNPTMPAEEINNSVFGIDIHPLSVQIAKTTLLLALGKEVRHARKPVHLNVILANTLLMPESENNLFGSEFTLHVDKQKFTLNTQVLDNDLLFDEALEVCNHLAEQTLGKKKTSEEEFEKILKKHFPKNGFNGNIISGFYKIYEALKDVKERGRNSIWKFILQNNYKPYFLAGKFDYVIGNPPWFTYSSVKNEEYQDILNALAEKYDVKPERIANYPHLEIAAIFMAYCSGYFLKENGKIAFVLPRSFFSADHHDNTRSGRAKGFRLIRLWDLESVSPLFRVPSCVLFAEKATDRKKRNIPAAGIEGKIFSGRLPAHNCNLKTALTKLSEAAEKWFYARQGKSSAFSHYKTKKQDAENPYKKLFRQGATIVPRAFYFVELNQEAPPDLHDRIVNLKTSKSILTDAKLPWKEIVFNGRMESKYLFRTAISKSILPFALFQPDLIVLPVEIENKTDKRIKVLNENEVRTSGDLLASRWFQNAENIWKIHRTEKNKNISSEKYLNWQNKLSAQNLNAPYLVLYNSSAKDANATVVKRRDLDLEFIVESKAYVFYTNNLQEAYYLAAILNSSIPNAMMKDFQTKGLFGARDVHKKILDIWFPKYDSANELHNRLAELGKAAHEKAAKFLKDHPPRQELTPLHLGRLRMAIKKHLSGEMKEMDRMVKKLIS